MPSQRAIGPSMPGGTTLALAMPPRTIDSQVDRYRPPVWRRAGAYDRFLATMLERLPRQTIPDGANAGSTPLGAVNLESQDDLIVALLRAWATVADVLSFYQERIANEGFLRTAVEERSVFELARLVGYRPGPGLAASTWLAFTVLQGRGIADDLVVPAGTRVLSVPSPGERPQPFETVEALPVRAEWSAMKAQPPARLVPQRVEPRTRELLLEGLDSRLAVGAQLLIAERPLGRPEELGRWRVVTARGLEHRPGGSALRSGAAVPRTRRGTTRLVWDPPLGPVDAEPYDEPSLYQFREQARLFGWDAEAWGDLSSRERDRHVAPVGGVVSSSDGGASWRLPAEGQIKAEVQAIAIDHEGRIYAGTARRGVIRSTDGGRSWQPVSSGLTRRDVRSLAVDADGHVYAGTIGGVYRTTDGTSWELVRGDMRLSVGRRGIGLANTRLPNVAIRSVASYIHPHDARPYVFAGTDAGIFRTRAAGEGWEPVDKGLPRGAGDTTDVVVQAVAVHADSHTVYLGTDHGVFYSREAGQRWIAVNDGLPTVETSTGPRPVAVQALLTYTDPYGPGTYILAATELGLFRAIAPDTTWSQIAPERFGPGRADIIALAVRFDEHHHAVQVLAGTAEGLLRSTDHGETWAWLPGPSGPVRALAASAGLVAAAVPIASPGGDEWPEYGIAGGQIDLDDTYHGITAGSWLLLQQPLEHGAPRQGLYPVLETQRVLRQDFGRRRVITRVLTAPDDTLAAYDLRRTFVFGRQQELPLARSSDPSIAGRDVPLAEALSREVPPGRIVVVGGKRIRARVARRATPLELRDVENRLLAHLAWNEVATVLEPPTALADGGRRWHLRHWTGVEGWTLCGPDDLAPETAGEDDAAVDEVATVAATVLDDGAGRPRLRLVEPLRNVYDGNTVVVLANLALATHGETVQAEVLGSGDHQRLNQRFPLRRAPLTWIADPRTGLPSSTLTVYVNRVAWRRVDSLYEAGPHDHAYTVESDDAGVSWVVFGDGVMGARLPSGLENVVATYRHGMGPDGAVRADSLVQLVSRPFGVRAVTNPLSAGGASAPEGPEEVRERAPLRARPLRRIVSLEDCVDFARTYPGVAKVDARVLWDGRHRLIHLTVATGNGARDDEGLRAELARAIEAARAGTQRVQVDPVQVVEFEAAAALRLERGRMADGVEAAARAALARAFGFGGRSIAQDIVGADVLALLQAVPGVVGVDLRRLARTDDPYGVPVSAFLRAQAARWVREGERIVPGQLLLLAPDGCRFEVIEA